MATSTTITLPTDLVSEAQIILDWDNGQWYISNIQSKDSTGNNIQTPGASSSSASSGVKIPEWDKTYKYSPDDIVAYKGLLYVSKQNANQGNTPDSGTFWWKPLVDLTGLDSLTIEGRNMTELARDILGGNAITDFYKKTEVDNIILTYFNNVNAKKISDWTLKQIQDDYIAKIAISSSATTQFVTSMLTDEGLNSFQQQMIDEFNLQIANDNINKF